MPEIDLLAVLVATVAAFVAGGTYYAVLGAQLAAASGSATTNEDMPPWKLAAELLRSLFVAVAVAGLASQGAIDGWTGGVLLAVTLWIAFPLVLWSGAMLHEGTPWRLAAIHAGDWLVKLLLIAVIVTAWP